MSEKIQVRSPHHPTEWNKYYRFRWEILRKPLGQKKGTERDEHESSAAHAFILSGDGLVVAVGRLHQVALGIGQIRYMAVHEKKRHQHLGTAVLAYLEEKARELCMHNLFLHAREEVLPFYERNNYRVVGESHLLYGKIQHYKMEKGL